jgi:hypothetical protein
MVEAPEMADEVVGDPASGRVAAQDFGLDTVVGDHLVGGKAAVIEHVGHVGAPDLAIGRLHLFERPVFLTPEDGAPASLRRSIVP